MLEERGIKAVNPSMGFPMEMYQPAKVRMGGLAQAGCHRAGLRHMGIHRNLIHRNSATSYCWAGTDELRSERL
jgi:hypothetical protein